MRPPEIAMVETGIVRGSRKTADAIEARFRQGAIFDAWTDGFSFDGWARAFDSAGLDLNAECRALPKKSPLPWDHINSGVSSAFLYQERNAATMASDKTRYLPSLTDEIEYITTKNANNKVIKSAYETNQRS